jgi:hypothetical protein
MSQNLQSCINKLKVISVIKNEKTRKKVLQDLFDNCLYEALNEIATNTVNQKVPLSLKQKQSLRRHKLKLQKLAHFTKNKTKRKKLTIQSGGYLQFIIPAVASVLTSFLKK